MSIPTGPRAMSQAYSNINKFRIPKSSKEQEDQNEGPGTPEDEPAPPKKTNKTSVNDKFPLYYTTHPTPPGLAIYIPDYSPTPSVTQVKRSAPGTPEEGSYESMGKPIFSSNSVKITTKTNNNKKIKNKPAVINLVTPGPEDKIVAVEDDHKKYETVYMFIHYHPSAKNLTSNKFPTLNVPHFPSSINANIYDRPFKKAELELFKGPENEIVKDNTSYPATAVENTLLLLQDQVVKFFSNHAIASQDQIKERNVFIEDINTIIRIGLAAGNPKKKNYAE